MQLKHVLSVLGIDIKVLMRVRKVYLYMRALLQLHQKPMNM